MRHEWLERQGDRGVRANQGRVGGNFEGAPLLLLHSIGARSGQERVNPMMYQAVGDGFAVFASKGGADSNPDWYYNLRAHPEARIEVGTETLDVSARVLDAEEREPIWQEQKARYRRIRRLRDKDHADHPGGISRTR